MLCRTDECVDERIVQFPFHEQARARRTALAGISKSTLDGGGRGLGYIGICEDDIRAFAAELKRNALDPVGRRLEQTRAGARLAGEGDLVDQRMPCHVLADLRTWAGQHVEHSVRHAGVHGEPTQHQRRERRIARRLEDYGAPGRQRRRDLPGRREEREIPGCDLRYNSYGLAQRKVEDAMAHWDGLAKELVHGTGIVVEYAGGGFDLVARVGDRLASAARLDRSNGVQVAAN